MCRFDARRGSPELQQVRLPVRFPRRRLRFSIRTHTSVLQYSDTRRCPGDNSIRLGRTKRYYTRRHLYKPPGSLYSGECTWTRTSRQPIRAITWHFYQQSLLEPLTVTRARASCFGERYRDVLHQNLDENNNTQLSTDCCAVVLRT